MIVLENDILSIAVDPKGAELQYIKHKQTKLNYLWHADAQYWAKHSPVLFPIVGKLKEDTYFYKGKRYTLPRHGFARDCIFSITQQSDNELTFTLNDSPETYAYYPFSFCFSICYRLQNNTLTCSYKVQNIGKDEMFFSVGAHPAFALPMIPHLQYSDYFLQFNHHEQLERWKLQDGLISSQTSPLELEQSKLTLHPSLFYEDAIVLKGLQSDSITLASHKDPHGIIFHFKDFPYFGIWASKDAPFICLEPWCGIADNVAHNQKLSEKEGINKLRSGETFTRSWSVECF